MPLLAPTRTAPPAAGLEPPVWWLTLPPYMRELVRHKLLATGHDVAAWPVG